MKIETISAILAIIWGVLGSWGLWLQNRAVWRRNADGRRSAESVSGAWVTTFLGMFFAFLFYGIAQRSIPMQVQGWLRVALFVPLFIGFVLFGDRRRTALALAAVYIAPLVVMYFKKEAAPVIFTGFSCLGIGASFLQALKIYKLKSRGKVAVELQVVYLLAVLSWAAYGFVRKDWPLVSISIGFTASYTTVVWMWFKYPLPHRAP